MDEILTNETICGLGVFLIALIFHSRTGHPWLLQIAPFVWNGITYAWSISKIDEVLLADQWF